MHGYYPTNLSFIAFGNTRLLHRLIHCKLVELEYKYYKVMDILLNVMCLTVYQNES
jgi:hypothetical protein